MIDLDGIDGLDPRRHLDLMPYIVARSEFVEPSSPNNPFNDGSRQFGTTGLDIKYGISSKFSAGRDIGRLFTAKPNDIFLVRLAYWFTR